MTESEFNERVDATLLRIEEGLDEADADIDYENASGILSLRFANGSRIIINRQAPTQEIWVAARSGGFHYRYNPDTKCWHQSSTGEELFAALSRLCMEQAGANITFDL